ncbi:Mth938-like domain-containing protein [Ideonella paludis]|uniref:Xcc1710-like domain-containing protein n=1 Tax=Ideonella paludis TaxID=1233411 RepID=A0ABS5DUL7_9BURK|nr:MTH938/NDUFAF3 family protein [Ideonella paludis]MBQ0934838.1 hypothetical protein [Ideonella paludis]
MKFQPDHLDGVNAIGRLEAGRIFVHQTPFTHSLLVPWVGEAQAWPFNTAQDLREGAFDAVLAWKPEVVIFGSGERLQFISPSLYRALIEARIGFETMDTAAACRTYNVLVNEGRRVVGAFILET